MVIVSRNVTTTSTSKTEPWKCWLSARHVIRTEKFMGTLTQTHTNSPDRLMCDGVKSLLRDFLVNCMLLRFHEKHMTCSVQCFREFTILNFYEVFNQRIGSSLLFFTFVCFWQTRKGLLRLVQKFVKPSFEQLNIHETTKNK